MSIDNQILAALARVESKLDALIEALADDEEAEPKSLDGDLFPGERDQSQSLG